MVFGAHRDAAAQERDWVTLCDGYGAHPFDDERAAVSLRSGQFLDRAVRYCREAVLQQPDNARLRFQLGAALVEQLDRDGVAHLNWAAARDYTAAQALLGSVGLNPNLRTLVHRSRQMIHRALEQPVVLYSESGFHCDGSD